jgi:hypothetical protein
MTAQEIERLAVVEQQLTDLDTRMDRMEGKLDAVLNTKADKEQVRLIEERQQTVIKTKVDRDEFCELRKLVIGLVVASCGSLAMVLIGLAVWLLQGHVVFN